MKTVNILLAATLAALAHPALAQAQGTPRTDARQERQQQRIGERVKSRQLTGKEAARLEKGQAKVGRWKRRPRPTAR